MFTLLRELSLRHLTLAPLRSALIVLGIALGVAVLVAAQATSQSMLASFGELVKRVSGRADLMVVGNESGIPGELAARVADIDGVAHSASALEITTHFVDETQTLLILGVDFLGDTHFLPFDPEEGEESIVEDPLAFANDPTAILISQTLAKQRGLRTDSAIELLTAEGLKTFHVRGILRDTGPAASFGGQVAVMFIDAAQIAFARGTLVDRIDVALAEGADIDTMVERITAVVGEHAHVERPEQIGERLVSVSEPLRIGLQLSGLVALLVGMFIIYNAIGIAVVQRRKETGLLRSLGVKRSAVVAHFCFEAMLLAVPGVLLGLLLARFFVVVAHQQTMDAINRVYVATPSLPEITPELALQGAMAGLWISVVAAFIPAWRGAAMDPVQALRPSARIAPAAAIPYRLLSVCGVLVMALGHWSARAAGELGGVLGTFFTLGGAAMVTPALVVLLRKLLVGPVEAVFGLPGRLGLDYVERNLGRSVINVLALMCAVSMSVSVSGWLTSVESAITDWFEQITAADLTVTAGSPFVDRLHISMAPSGLERIADVEGLKVIQPVRIIEQRYGEQVFSLVASDTRGYLAEAARRDRSWRIVEGEPLASDDLYKERAIVLGQNTAHLLGLSVGDSMRLPTPTGAHDFKVRAVIIDYSSEHGAGYIDRRHYLELWKDDALDVINLYLADSADVAAVAHEVSKRLGGGDAIFVTRTTDLRKQFLTLLHDSFSYTRLLEWIVLLIALFGVVGTMVSAVLDRVREVGMMRAVGATRAQVVSALVVEASFLGFCATVGGAITGTIMCSLFLEAIAMEQSGWQLDFIFPWEGTLRIGGMIIATSALAGFFPGLRAARMEVAEAIAYE